jgi:hypothetical protein
MQNNLLAKLSAAHLRRAADIRDHIEALESQLAKLLHVPEQLTIGNMMKKKRTMSAAARKKISEAAKARWAKVRADKNK